jgi:hypothetical protein
VSTYSGSLEGAISWAKSDQPAEPESAVKASVDDDALPPEQRRWRHAVNEARAIKRELAELNSRYRLANESDYEWAVPAMLGLESVCYTIIDGIAAAVAHDLGPEQRASRT